MKPLWVLLMLSTYFNSLLCDESKVTQINTNTNNETLNIIKKNITASDKSSSNSTVNNGHNSTVTVKLIEQKQTEIVGNPSPEYYGNVPGGFFVFMSLGFVVIVVIIYKVYSGRFSRAERRYGVHGQHGTQELTPLPLAIEDDDSENEDQTLFDIHQQLHARDNFVL